MAAKRRKEKKETSGVPVTLPSLEDRLSSDRSFEANYARTLAAIACHDNVASPAEIEALMELAREAASPALVGTMIMRALHDREDLDKALSDLKDSAKEVSEAHRKAALDGATVLIALQGPRAGDIAKKLAKALGQKADALELPTSTDWGMLDEISDKAWRVLRRDELACTAIECGEAIGNMGLVEHYRAYRKGEISRNELCERVRDLGEVIAAQIDGGKEWEAMAEIAEKASEDLRATAEELREQVEQRLALVDERITFERDSFREDMDDVVHDAGNSIERGIADRLLTDDWKKPAVWKSIARTQFGQDAERRIDRVLRRREDGLRLLNEDLRLFQSQIAIAHQTVFRREHYARLSVLMPSMRLSARVISQLDSIATVTIATTTLAATGTGAAISILGYAAVVPVIVPALPYVGGALVAAAAFKWLRPPAELRKYAEIRDKRKAFEKIVRDWLEQGQKKQEAELETIRKEFMLAAEYLLAPIWLEAEAARSLPVLQKRLIKQAMGRTQSAVAKLTAQLQKEAVL